ncbi:MAG: hypothetical protein KF898_03550 [Parachlamydiales bacterium]|nr:hypothetical protein [Candidatus Acheromyda pituitae]
MKNREFGKTQFAAKTASPALLFPVRAQEHFTHFSLRRSTGPSCASVATGPSKSLRSQEFEPDKDGVEAAQLE